MPTLLYCCKKRCNNTQKTERSIRLANKTTETVEKLVRPVIESMGLVLWDVRYVKEGTSWYLRIYIDSDEGISIDDCTDVSHAIDPIIDEADPIKTAYYLEVCSPGLARELTRDEHYEIMRGEAVIIHLIREIDGKRDISGELITRDKEQVTVLCDGKELQIPRGNISSVKLDDDNF